MSNENRRSWYKKPEIIIPMIIAILAALISSPIWIGIINPPPSDFNIAVKPMKGEVQQGGVIQTTVTVMGIHGYAHTVSLSASGQPSDIIVTFNPPIGGPTPSYASDVIISVGSTVPAGDYTLVMQGTGADGKEHSCNYILTIRRKEVTSTPTPTLTPTPTPTVKITSPKEGDEITVSTIVSGTFSGELPEGQYMWVVINPHPSPGQWWPQGGRINPWKGQWNVQVGLGREKEDTGKEFDIAVILVNEKDDQYYRDYLKTGQETGSYPGIPLPASADIIDRITVMRK